MATSPLEPGQIVAGRYRVESQIGIGGMGVVYLVHHVHTDEKLALKVLHAQVLKDEAAVERFRREARAPAKVASEHVTRVTDADTAAELGGAPFYVMEYLQGKDLERIVVEKGPIAPELVVEYLRQTARALDKAHDMGVVHRDLKPENLFLTRREDDTPCIKLLDFGIARLAGSELPAQLKTQAGAMFGTPAYMSPEQMEGDLERVGPAADIWALGLIAFKLLVGTDFWTGTTVAVLCAQVLSIPIPTPTIRGSKYGPRFDDWFATCVARDIGSRYKSAGEAVHALAAALGVPLQVGRRSALSMVDAATEMGPGLETMRDAAIATRAMTSPGPLATIHGVAPAPAPSSPGAYVRGSQPSYPNAGAPAAAPSAPGLATPPFAQQMLDAPAGGTIAPTTRPDEVEGRRLRVRAFVAVIALVLVASAILVALVMPGTPTPPDAAPSGAKAAADPTPTPSASVLVVPGATAPPAEPAPSSSVAALPSVSAPPALSGKLPGTAQAWPKPGDPPHTPSATPPSATPPPPPPPDPPKAQDPPKPPPKSGAPTPEQKKRLSSLQRLCDQGIYTPAECAAKRAAIMAQ